MSTDRTAPTATSMTCTTSVFSTTICVGTVIDCIVARARSAPRSIRSSGSAGSRHSRWRLLHPSRHDGRRLALYVARRPRRRRWIDSADDVADGVSSCVVLVAAASADHPHDEHPRHDERQRGDDEQPSSGPRCRGRLRSTSDGSVGASGDVGSTSGFGGRSSRSAVRAMPPAAAVGAKPGRRAPMASRHRGTSHCPVRSPVSSATAAIDHMSHPLPIAQPTTGREATAMIPRRRGRRRPRPVPRSWCRGT